MLVRQRCGRVFRKQEQHVQGLEGIHKGFSVGGAWELGSWGPQWVVLLSDTALGTGINERCESGWPRR